MPVIAREVARELLPTPPLALVIAQVQFEPILRLGDADFVAPFQEAIRAEYPRLGRVGAIDIVIGPQGIESRDVQQGGWALASADDNWAVVVGPESLSLQARSYENYETLRSRFVSVLSEFLRIFHPGQRTRVGLRYVNRLVISDGALETARTLVKPEILGMAAAVGLSDDAAMKHSVAQTRFANVEGQLVARYGFLRSGVAVDQALSPLPPLETDHILLDFDYIDVRRVPKVNVEDVCQQLDDFHEGIYRLFVWSLTPEGIAALRGGTPAAEAAVT